VNHDHADIGYLFSGITARIAKEQANQYRAQYVNTELQIGKCLSKGF